MISKPKCFICGHIVEHTGDDELGGTKIHLFECPKCGTIYEAVEHGPQDEHQNENE